MFYHLNFVITFWLGAYHAILEPGLQIVNPALRRKSQRIKTVETSRRRPFVPMTSHIHLRSCRFKEPQLEQYHCQLKRYGRPTGQLKSAKEREGKPRFWGENQRGFTPGAAMAIGVVLGNGGQDGSLEETVEEIGAGFPLTPKRTFLRP